jgi:CRP/FNR family transcriptional regulator, putaive post-exponential-phase nitrogen-starvation regulator
MQKTRDTEAIHLLAERLGLQKIFTPQAIKVMELRTYADQETICAIGDRLEGLYVLASGKLKIYTVLENGKAMLLRYAHPPAVVGDVEWMAQYPVRNIVEAVGMCTTLHVSHAAIHEHESSNPAFLQWIIKNLSQKIYTLGSAAAMNQLYPVENRLASYLLSLQPDASGIGAADEIRTSTLTETAELLGTSYRHLNRVISRFIDEGILERKNRRLIIKDEERLRALSSHHLYT